VYTNYAVGVRGLFLFLFIVFLILYVHSVIKTRMQSLEAKKHYSQFVSIAHIEFSQKKGFYVSGLARPLDLHGWWCVFVFVTSGHPS